MNTPKKKKNRIYTMLSGITFLVFLGCAAYLIFYLGIQPYYLKQQSKKINVLQISAGAMTKKKP